MGISDATSETPKYVLIDGTIRIGPRVAQTAQGLESSAVYGFSSKNAYDQFCKNSQLALKPYPFVKGYLRNQIDASSDRLLLVILDATGPAESGISAASFYAVLEAQEKSASHVVADYRLSLAEEADSYRLDEPLVHQNG